MTASPFAIERLAEWAVAQREATIPADVLHQAERCILDVIACASVGRGHPSVSSVTEASVGSFGMGRSDVWFADHKMNAVGAAWINANAASILDLDDGNRQAMGHPGAAIVPAVLSLAQELDATRDQVLRALIVGYEVAVRVGAAEQTPSFHSANYCCFGIAAACSVLSGLPAEKIAHALGIVAYYGPRVSNLTLSVEMGSNVKESMPWSVVAGMMAAQLAAAGFTGNRDALDIPERIKTSVLLNGLGEGFLIQRTYFKKYSCCRWMHSATEALLQIMSTQSLVADDLARVDIETFVQATQLHNSATPETLEDAQYSVPYGVALAAVRGEHMLMPMTKAALGDDKVSNLAARINLYAAAEMNGLFPDRTVAKVTAHTKDGAFSQRVDLPWGEADQPPSDADLVEKFNVVAKGLLAPERISAIADASLGDAPLDVLFALLFEPLN